MIWTIVLYQYPVLHVPGIKKRNTELYADWNLLKHRKQCNQKGSTAATIFTEVFGLYRYLILPISVRIWFKTKISVNPIKFMTSN